MSAQPQAVIIEDDPDVRELIDALLTQSGFDTYAVANGYDGVEAVRELDPELTTLDVSMPGMDGFATAKRIREFSSTYLIILTALGDEIDVVQGLESGADDYIVKPFRPRELRARIATLQRRAKQRNDVGSSNGATPPAATVERAAPTPQPAPSPVVEDIAVPAAPEPQTPTVPVQPQPTPEPVRPPEPAAAPAPEPAQGQAASPVEHQAVFRSKGLTVDSRSRTVFVDDTPINLTRSEFDLVAALAESGRRVRTKAELVLLLRGESYVTTYYVTEADKRAVSVHMANLRRKIGDNSATPRWIETVRGVGYRWAAND